MEKNKMFSNENEFKKIVDGLDIDSRPNDSHRTKLREQMLSEFSESSEQKYIQPTEYLWKRLFIKIAAAAAAILIFAGALYFHHAGKPAVTVTQEATNPADMMKIFSLNMAYKKGDLEGLDRQLDKIRESFKSKPSQSSVTQLYMELEQNHTKGNNNENQKL